MSENLNLNLKVWRQKSPKEKGHFENYRLDGVSTHASFLEMIDVLNTKLIKEGKDPVAFDHDCREGICGSCAMTINGAPHGPETGTATCQLHMRLFKNEETIIVEPFRARAFPIVKDLMTDRTSLDRIIAAGGFVSVNTGNAVEANTTLIGRDRAERAMDAAACIGCGACVATCKNASAMLFVAAKVSHLAEMPQGDPERKQRVRMMLKQHDTEGFGACSNTGACEAACPKEIKISTIPKLSAELARASFCSK